jgi:hypothetical protein
LTWPDIVRAIDGDTTGSYSRPAAFSATAWTGNTA